MYTGENKLVIPYNSDDGKPFEDINMWNMGYKLVAGIDEAGRGPLAGPVVAACVILPKNELPDGILDKNNNIRDSKRLSPAQRESLYQIIMSSAIAVGIGRVGPEQIDEINILNATRIAMEQAIHNCSCQPDCVLIDAVELYNCPFPQYSFTKGDIRSLAIAAASIIAKVTRDREMAEWALKYPEYGFDSHMGYGTKQHIECIQRFGLSPIHRKSFCKKIIIGNSKQA
ncbi:MAG: ribonuclease HII [Clostridiales bacterium]|nr:ribonuclease HII [Clostridiales bacterium]